MVHTHLERLCTLYRLGTISAGPQPVQGGLLHRVWHLHTTQGQFAVKQLNTAIMQRGAAIQDIYRLTERIAALCVEQGVPAIAALAPQQEVLQRIDDDFYMVYPWIAGRTCTGQEVSIEQCRQIGGVLARIHALKLHRAEMPALEWKHFHNDDWDILTYQAVDMELPWANAVRAALPKLERLMTAYEEAGPRLMSTLLISHRDMDAKNVLWSDEATPHIIDWEAAGYINPGMEIVSEALNWSGLREGEIREESFRAVLEGYGVAGGQINVAGIDAFHGCVGTWLGWLHFNMRRSLGESVSSEEERLLGADETKKTLNFLHRLSESQERVVKWVAEYPGV